MNCGLWVLCAYVLGLFMGAVFSGLMKMADSKEKDLIHTRQSDEHGSDYEQKFIEENDKPEPREFWVIYSDGDILGDVYKNKQDAIDEMANYYSNICQLIKVREVIDD